MSQTNQGSRARSETRNNASDAVVTGFQRGVRGAPGSLGVQRSHSPFRTTESYKVTKTLPGKEKRLACLQALSSTLSPQHKPQKALVFAASTGTLQQQHKPSTNYVSPQMLRYNATFASFIDKRQPWFHRLLVSSCVAWYTFWQQSCWLEI